LTKIISVRFKLKFFKLYKKIFNDASCWPSTLFWIYIILDKINIIKKNSLNYFATLNGFKTMKGKKRHKSERKEPTSNVSDWRASLCLNVVLEFGTAAWIIQANELNWFKLKESPTNIIFFPLCPLRKFKPLNLQKKKEKKTILHKPI
jgi:hypothetical protein